MASIQEWVEDANDYLNRTKVKDSSDIVWERGADGVSAFLVNTVGTGGGGRPIYIDYVNPMFYVLWEGIDVADGNSFRVVHVDYDVFNGGFKESKTLAGFLSLYTNFVTIVSIPKAVVTIPFGTSPKYLILKATFNELALASHSWEVRDSIGTLANEDNVAYVPLATIVQDDSSQTKLPYISRISNVATSWSWVV